MHKILIIDDEKDNLDALRRLLKSHYEVITCESPFEALKEVQLNDFSLVISDQRMPEMTGVDLLEKVHQLNPDIVRILITGYSEIEAVVEAINRGKVYRYIAKPWDHKELLMILSQAVETFELKQEIKTKTLALSKSNEHLKLALEELTVLDQAKSSFLSLVSHELNTPLTVLNTHVSLLNESSPNLNVENLKTLSHINKATETFSDIVSDVILFIDLQSNPKLNLTRFDCSASTKKAVQAVAEDAEEKSLRFKVSLQKDLDVQLDIEKIELALAKIYSICVRRASKDQQVSITVKKDQGRFVYSIRYETEAPLKSHDMNILEPPEDMKHHQSDGVGLGLGLARMIAETHGGEMKIELDDKEQSVALYF